MGMVIDARLTNCCIDCVESGDAGLGEGDETYRVILNCGCGESGPANYDDGERIGYFCGGSERCIP